MDERTVSVPKILCHPDGAIFCNWHPGKGVEVYAVYLCDQDTPPAPESLKLKINDGTFSLTYLAGLVWKPVIQVVQTGEPGEMAVQGPYDPETGERV